jgi:hypothetical protein
MTDGGGKGISPGIGICSLGWLVLVCLGCASGSGVPMENPGAAGSIAAETVELESMIVPYPPDGPWDTQTDEDAQAVRFERGRAQSPGAPGGGNVVTVIVALSDATSGWIEEESSYIAAVNLVEGAQDVLSAPAPPSATFHDVSYDTLTVHERLYRQFDFTRDLPASPAEGLEQEQGRLYVYVPEGGGRIFYLLQSTQYSMEGEAPSPTGMELKAMLQGFVPMP